MIRFFRSIRQSLLAQGRITRYLTYAVGEILLVVIGIFLALQLNNWNAERKRDQQELGLLAEMRENLAMDLKDCRYNIEANQRYERGNRAVLKHLTERTPFHDSLRVHYANLFGSTTLTANTSAYDNLKSIGIDLIRNDSLRRKMTALYSERYDYLKNLEFEADGRIQMDHILPQVHAKVLVDTMWVSGQPYDAVALMDDRTFQGALRTNLFIREWMVKMYGTTEKRITKLMEMIDRELEARR
ncbi:MAG: hypothetical protein KIT10_04755 [Flavobacteriales bacterium]|nr:hypothetical protein [Flavobacteriales bacterium]